MAITTYSELQAAIANYMARDDLTAYIPDFVTLAEARINRDIRVRFMETEDTLATTGGISYVDLPDDYLELRAIQVVDTVNSVLSPMTPPDFNAAFAGNASGRPTNYSIIGTQLKLGPQPDAAYSLGIIYYAKVPALTVDAPTNWLLTRYPDIYLYGALIEAQPFIQNDDRIQIWMGFYDRAIAALKGEDARAKWTGATLRPSIDVLVSGRSVIGV